MTPPDPAAWRSRGPSRSGRARRASQAGAADAPRRAALDLLAAVRERGAYANLVLPELLRARRITGRDAALATELGYGTCRAIGLLDAVLQACVDRPLSTVDGDLLDALRLGAYQLLRTRIPNHAAVATTVELVRAARGRGAAGFVNAVLRRVAGREEQAWVAELAPNRDADPVGHLAFATAHPRWIAEAFSAALGGDPGDPAKPAAELAAALAADDARPAVHLAARPGVLTAAELAAITGGQPAPYSPYGVHLGANTGDLAQLDVLRDGTAAVQDEGSQLVALALANAPLDGQDAGRWLDLCAGPGGKAALLGALVRLLGPVGPTGPESGMLDAVERAEHRARLVERACAGLPVRVHVADGRASGLPAGTFDRVLVDVPCTGLGALRRRPEARWRRTPDALPELTALQRGLLAAALTLARPGGVVGYVTCSPHRAETVHVVADVLAGATPATPVATPGATPATPVATPGANPVATQLDARPLFPGVPHLGDGPHVQLWPHRHGTDAMFCALLRRQ